MIFPSRRSKHSRTRCCSFSRQVVTKIRSPQTTGEECPLPGMGAFHRILSFSLHRTGTFVSVLVPSPFGPRHCGHSPARLNGPTLNNVTQTTKHFTPISPPGLSGLSFLMFHFNHRKETRLLHLISPIFDRAKICHTSPKRKRGPRLRFGLVYSRLVV